MLLSKENFWKSLGFKDLEADEYKRRTTAVELGFFSALGGVIYTLLYSYLGFPVLSIAAAAYVIVFFINLFILYTIKNYGLFKAIQLLSYLAFPLAAQLIIGGFIQGSAVALASFLAPAGALLYAERKIARRYFYAFATLIAAAALWEYFFLDFSITLPRHVIIIFFVTNIVTTLCIIYFILESFLKKLEELRAELKQSLFNLKATQAQLIQSEKMASLGELTAGIAHEIQNPLNFVNNFSEVNLELIAEMKDEIDKGNLEDVKSIARDIAANEQKINHHGKRADEIVKGMLQHSRTSSGIKEPTNINLLADEYLKLAYHGLRAKDKSFNVTLKTDYSESIGKINIVPQDIGRVILNLITNAFYTVAEKKHQQPDGYEPTVSITTKKNMGKAEIKVADNGNGIPLQVLDKIFQPFFTTKPTGQGTGLGLSLSYDIIKAHGGEIKVETKEGQGAEFIISIPIVSIPN